MKAATSKEKLILEAAEEEFLSKGYSGAKTTSIAKKAGVTHAMLHYYYRTKENLFQKVFQQKVRMIGDSFEVIFDENLPFETVVKKFTEKHFDFLMKNPELINFVQNEVRANNENIVILRDILLSKVQMIIRHLEEILKPEIAKGAIRAVEPLELLTSIISLNLSAAIFYSVTGQLGLYKNQAQVRKLLKKKKEDHVRYILFTLKP